MIEINLLPWRDRMREKYWRWGKRCAVLLVACLLLALLVHFDVLHGWHAAAKPRVSTSYPSPYQAKHYDVWQKIRFAGYLRQGNREVGLMRLPNDEIREVHVGDALSFAGAHVKSISPDRIVVSTKYQTERVLQGN